VWLVDLAPLADARLVPSAVAQVLGFDFRSDDPVPGLVGALRDRRLALVLENCEHVIEVAATLAAAILKGAGSVHILATSRERLRVEGEHVERLPPLSSGAPLENLSADEALAFPAVELFNGSERPSAIYVSLTGSPSPGLETRLAESLRREYLAEPPALGD
jgi:predicted ATPase